MNKYLCLLRGINVSGHKKIKMLDLRELLSKYFSNVQTYIQSGNIILESHHKDKNQIAEIVKNYIQQNYGWKVPTLVLYPNELQSILQQNPYANISQENEKLPYVCIPNKSLMQEDLIRLQEINFPEEYFYASSNAIYLYSTIPANKSKLSNNLFERKLNTSCTTRNWRTLNKLNQMISS